MKILVVDDSTLQNKVASNFLSEFGEVENAFSVKEAIAKVKTSLQNKETFDLITMDYYMSDGVGTEAIQTIRKLEKIFQSEASKVIYITGSTDEEALVNQCSDLESVIIKPIKKDKVLKKLKDFSLLKN